jgi:short-subunit dehydrogenase
VEAFFYETDLSKKENLRLLAQWANAYPVFALVNNAGRGGTKPFLEAGDDYLDGILQLNIRATALLTRQMLPTLLQQKKSYLLNVASMAAFAPIGYKTVYPASKRFVQHFSAGLREELKGAGLSVSVLYPGAMMTNADASQRIERQGLLGKLGLLPTERIAQIAIAGLLQGKADIVPGRANFFTAKLLSALPQKWTVKWLTKAIRREVPG